MLFEKICLFLCPKRILEALNHLMHLNGAGLLVVFYAFGHSLSIEDTADDLMVCRNDNEYIWHDSFPVFVNEAPIYIMVSTRGR